MKKGFTLIELIIVIIIVGVLASFAVPQYVGVVERAKKGKAQNSIGIIAQAEKMFRAEQGTYVDVPGGDLNTILGNYVELDEIDNDTDWDYEVAGATPASFTITAERESGSNAGEKITLDESGVWGGNFSP